MTPEQLKKLTQLKDIVLTAQEVKKYTDALAATKQDVIEDLQQIREGAAAGAEAVQPDGLLGLIDNGTYDSDARKILLRHGTTVISEIDAAPFIKDGMISNVMISPTVQGEAPNLVITFNTDAGKNPISIPLSSVFNPTNYYTKTETDSLIGDLWDETDAVRSEIIDMIGYPVFNPLLAYSPGDVVVYGGRLYLFVSSHSAGLRWNARDVSRISIRYKLESLYEKPRAGIPLSDLEDKTQEYIEQGHTAYQKPASGIPASDLADGVIPDMSTKQDTLVSGLNIKTINGEPIIGSGNISIGGGSGKANQKDITTVDVGTVLDDYSSTYLFNFSGEPTHTAICRVNGDEHLIVCAHHNGGSGTMKYYWDFLGTQCVAKYNDSNAPTWVTDLFFENYVGDVKSAIQGVKVNGTALTPDANMAVNVRVPNDYQVDYSRQYLTFEALESGTFTFSTNALQYSMDGGTSWTTLASGTASPTVAAGSRIMWKQTGLTSNNGIGKFSATGRFNVSGNVMSLYYGDNFAGQTNLTGKASAFRELFYQNTNVVDASNLILPATTLATSCYRSMFGGCTSLVAAPELPATTLAVHCYRSMFNSCAALVTAPALPAKYSADYCYESMFSSCKALNFIKCLLEQNDSDTGTWMNNVAATGVFVRAVTTNLSNNSPSGIPSGWTAYTVSEYELAHRYELNAKQDALVSGTNIKTVNGESLLGSGNITIQGGSGGTRVQADWDEDDSSDDAYIKNKPTIPSVTGKADKVASATNGNFAGLDANGNLTDSGSKASDFATASQGAKADTAYQKPSGGIPSTDLASSVQTSLGKADSAIQSVKVNGTALTPDANKAVNVKIPNDYQVDYSKQYLTFEALEDSTFTFSQNALQYSVDGGNTWTSLAANTASPIVTAGSKIMWKQTGLIPSLSAPYGIGTFSSTGNFNAYGNIMSLYYGDNFIGQTNLIGKDYAFYALFYFNDKLVDASNLILPATTLATYCYATMFAMCTSLTAAPQLIATTLVENCYMGMFMGCELLIFAPELPATTLADYCYRRMFRGCTSLTTAPKLPATILAEGC